MTQTGTFKFKNWNKMTQKQPLYTTAKTMEWWMQHLNIKNETKNFYWCATLEQDTER